MPASPSLAALALAAATSRRRPVRRDYLPREPGAGRRPDRRQPPPEAPAEPAPSSPRRDGGRASCCAASSSRARRAVPAAELAPIWAELVGQPVTLATLDEIAARIGAAYRARGYVLSQAVLPAQTIEDGVVRVQVVEGFVDRVASRAAPPNQQRGAARLFAPVRADRPLRLPTLERSVLLARDTFGGTVETVLEPSPDTFAAADLERR